MKKIFFALLSFLMPLQVFAAGPVTQFFVSGQWQEALNAYSNEEGVEFILGNLYSDIRYLGVPFTSPKIEGVKDVATTLDPFQTGINLHAYVDQVRENLINQSEAGRIIESSANGYSSVLLQLIEDEIVYNQIDKLTAIAALIAVDPSEIKMGASPEAISKWHYFLTLYFTNGPSKLLAYLAYQNKPFLSVPAETVKAWSLLLPSLAKDPDVVAYVSELQTNLAVQISTLQ